MIKKRTERARIQYNALPIEDLARMFKYHNPFLLTFYLNIIYSKETDWAG